MTAKIKGLLTLQHSKFLFISPFPLQKWTSAACRSVCQNLQINSGEEKQPKLEKKENNL